MKLQHLVYQYWNRHLMSSATTNTIRQQKTRLRQSIQDQLVNLSTDTIHGNSRNVIQQLLTNQLYVHSRSICCYVSTEYELQTDELIQHALLHDKHIYIPCIHHDTEHNHSVMDMVRLYGMDDYMNLQTNKWGIREPSITYTCTNTSTTIQRANALDDNECNVLIVPGVAFNIHTNERLGHGRGYYDRYITRINTIRNKNKLLPVTTIGLSLACQCVDDIPTDIHDVKLNHILHPK